MTTNSGVRGALLAILLMVVGLGAALVLPASGVQGDPDDLAASAELGRVLDREGVASRRGVLERRWGGLEAGSALAVGDWLEVGSRGANALAVRLTSAAKLTLGPGTLVELVTPGRVRLVRGELAVDAQESAPVELLGPAGASLSVAGRAVARARDARLERLDQDPGWLRGYESDASTEALGSLLANVDGRNVPLTIGYHKVTVDVRDQIARTVIEESFENHTSSVLEGVFYFPLPADASISGFGMWIGGELVQGDIVEKERAREIYETILREKRDPGLLEWAGGNIFKARVYPIGSEKRIRIAYTQVLPKVGDSFAYHYALQSEMLRKTPLKRLEIEVNISSRQELAQVECPSHDCRIRTTEHAASVELSAEEFVPERDFELRVRTRQNQERVTVVPHRRGDEGYFMLLVDAPTVRPDAQRAARPLELLILADTSGSMWGPPRTHQLAVVETLLSALGAGDSFNLATTDVETRWAFERSVDVEATDAAAQRRQALDFLEARDPLGWTDLQAAFASALERAGPSTHVVYVGDGVPTSGSADPVELAHELARCYAGQGSFHAIVPGSSSEQIVLRAVAGLGGGSLRQIGGGSDPARTAFDLLEEITGPSLRDVEIEFEGVAPAAVYPRTLPNLPAGGQQVIVGRFDPAAQALTGSVRVSARLDGEALQFEVPLDLRPESGAYGAGASEVPGEGNSFIPRLWARKHLDHLLDQGRTPEVRERVIALSEDYQIVTPYSSFLVLESDADRERFGVQKQFRMRDGEEFFAAGREQASHALVRQQMLAAKGWRRELREALLNDLRDMGRSLTEWLDVGPVPFPAASELGALGYAGNAPMGGKARAYRGPGESVDFKEDAFADAEAQRGAESEVDELRQLEGDDAPMPVSRDDGDALEEEVAFERVAAKRVRSEVPSRSLGGRLASPEVKRRGDWRHNAAYGDPFAGLFPNVGPPRAQAPELSWPADVLQALGTLDRRASLAASDAVWRFDVARTWVDGRGRSSTASGRTFLSSAGWVALAAHVEGNEFALDWCLAGQRGVLQAGFLLGRERPAVEGDTGSWPAPFDWHFGDRVRGYAGYEARLVPDEAREPGVVVVQLRSPGVAEDSWFALRIDLVHGVLLEEAWYADGERSRGRTFEDLREVGGFWWPGRIRSWQAGEAESAAEVRISVQSFPQGELGAIAATELERRDHAILLPEAEVEVAAAKNAQASGDAGLAERWTLLRHYASTQRWALALPQLEALYSLVGTRPGVDAIRLTFLQQSRRHEELRTELARLAARLAQAPVEADFGLASRVLGYTGALHPGIEVLALLEALRPVFARQTAIVDAELAYDERVLQALEAMNRPEELFRARREAAAKWPFALGMQTALVQLTARRGDVQGALAELDRVEQENGPWLEWERTQLRHQRLDILWNGYRLEQLVDRVLDWEADASGPMDSSVYDRYLSALVMLDREREAGDVIDEWLRAAPTSLSDARAQGRLHAAVSHCLGQGYNLYHQRLDEPDLARLDRAARSLIESRDGLHVVGRIVQHWSFRATDTGQRLIVDLFARLRGGVEDMPAERVVTLLGWLAPARGTLEEVDAAWPDVLERVYTRWLSEDDETRRAQLEGALLAYGGVELRLRCWRQKVARAADEAQRIAATEALFMELLAQPWSAAIQAEALGLLADLASAQGGEARGRNLDRCVLAMYRLVDWMLDARTRAELESLPDFESLSRRSLQAQRTRVGAEVRASVIELLGALEDTLEPEELKRWARVERTFLEIRGRVDLGSVWERSLPRLAQAIDRLTAAQGSEPELRTRILAARWVDTCTYLLLSTEEALLAQRTDALEVQLQRLIEAGTEFPDGRVATRSLWLALNRPEALEAALASWFDGGEDFAFMRWGRDYAHVLAERGQLALAVEVLEEIDRRDELTPTDLALLAGWYTALDLPDQARLARSRSFEVMDESSLSGGLYRSAQSVQRSGEGPPPALDDEVPERLVALLRKAQAPQQHFWILRDLYRATKDFRLLECLPRALIGQSAQGVYPLLGEVATLAQLIDEEATVDRVLAGIERVRSEARTDVDRRALWLLEFQIVPRATYQSQGVERHVERALAALENAFDGQWADGEAFLMADLLANQGVLMSESLTGEQLRQLRALVDLAGDPDERLMISQRLASTLWMLQRTEAAVQTLEAAILLRRSQGEGGLPQTGREALAVLSSWLATAGSHRRAEALWLEELSAAQTEETRLWLELQLLNLYQQAVQASAQVSLGKGEELYAALLVHIDRALSVRTNEHHAAQLVGVLCDLWSARGKSGRKSGPLAQARAFAFSRSPEILALYQYRAGQRIVGQLADCLRQLGNVNSAVEFLVVRAETEPGWLARQNQDFWQQHAWRLGNGLSEVGNLPAALEQRILAIVLDELNADLRSRRSRNRSVYDERHSSFWAAQRSAFLAAALAFVESQREEPHAVLYAAEYLHDGLAAHGEAIDALRACYRRGILHLDGRDRLVQYLQQQGRWSESLPLAEELVADVPSEVRYHVMALLAHANSGDRGAAVSVLTRAQELLREQDSWNEHAIAALADGCRAAQLTQESLPLYADAIALHVRARANRGVGDGVLATYYRQQSDAFATLGRTREAVDAAAGAIVSWGRGTWQRQTELENLVDVLSRAGDLQGFVRELDREVEESGLENPILRRALGDVYLRRGNPSAAATQLELALAARPDDIELHRLRVRALDEMQRPDLAASAVLEWARRAGHEWSLYTDLGRRRMAQEDAQAAERAFTTLAELSPEESEGHAELASVRAQQGRWEDAAGAWRHVIRIRSGEPTGYLGLARSLLEQGELVQAREVAEQVVTTRWPEHFGDVASQARALLDEIRARG